MGLNDDQGNEKGKGWGDAGDGVKLSSMKITPRKQSGKENADTNAARPISPLSPDSGLTKKKSMFGSGKKGKKGEDDQKAEPLTKSPSKVLGSFREDPAAAAAKKAKKKKFNGLPPTLVLGARVEITQHYISSMAGARGVSLGTYQTTTTPRKRMLVAVKLAGPHRKGTTVDVDNVSVVGHHRQRTFAGVVDPKAEKPVAHIDVDDLHVLSAPEHPDPAKRTEAALSHLSGAGWWLSHMFGHVLGPLVRASKAAARVLPRPPKRPKPDPSSGGGNASSKSRFGRQASSKVEPEEAEVWPPHVEPRSTELGVLLHQVFDKEAARQYEVVFVAARGYSTLVQARGMTPDRLREVAEEARMFRADMGILLEKLAPMNYDERAQYPLFAPF